MAYDIKYTDFANKGVITVQDNTINTDTSLQIPGKFRTDYGEVIGENFLNLLENFAAPDAPSRPVEGQLWYDNSEGVDQLKIYDGTSWLSASGLKKGTSEPIASVSNSGDLWVDTDNQQLYLYTGSNWILVGPSFSDGLVTGATPVTLVGQDNAEYTVLQIDIRDVTVGIISNDEFFPKTTIQGFTAGIKKGFNLSSANDAYTFAGVAEQALNVKVTNDPTDGTKVVSANDLLRSDSPSTTNFTLRVKNDTGVEVGSTGQLKLQAEGNQGVIQHTVTGSNLDIRVKDGATVKTVMRFDSSQRVGINNLDPNEALDVIGNIQINPSTTDTSLGKLIVNNSENSLAEDEGSIVTLGGIGVGRNIYVNGDAIMNGVLQTGNISPDENGVRNIGTNINRYDQIYANTFFGQLQGNVDGTVSGRAGSAERLTTATTFRMEGDVSATSFSFDGKSGESTKTFTTTVADSFISTKNELFTIDNRLELLVNKNYGDDQGIYKVSRLNFLSALPTIPIGSIMPFGGSEEPSGWLFCDGRQVLKSEFTALFQIIGYSFLDPDFLDDGGVNLFALPDMRGRFPLGLDNMNGDAAGRVTSSGATAVGNNLGSEKATIDVSNLPEHEHDLRGDAGSQYYAIRDNTGAPLDGQAIQYDAPTGTQAGQALPSSGGIKTTQTLGTPMDIMNPYLALNYIIYTGN